MLIQLNLSIHFIIFNFVIEFGTEVSEIQYNTRLAT